MNTINNITTSYLFGLVSGSQMVFCGVKYQKLIDKVEHAEKLKKLNITFEQLERMYNEIGYDVIHKPGSHAIVNLTENINIHVPIPHKQKYVHFNDLKRFLLVKEGKFEEATRVH